MQVSVLVGLLVSVASVQEDPHFFLPIDCDDVYRRDNTSSSGVYAIYPGGPTSPLHVFCDMETDGGRWTVSILHRKSYWISYQKTFRKS